MSQVHRLELPETREPIEIKGEILHYACLHLQAGHAAYLSELHYRLVGHESDIIEVHTSQLRALQRRSRHLELVR